MLDALIDPEAPVEELAQGFIWTEGPVWIPERQALFFSDVPANRMYRWTETEGVNGSIFRRPAMKGMIPLPSGNPARTA